MTDWKKMFMLLANANNLGIYVTEADGHWWIESEPTEYMDYNETLCVNGIRVNNKIYGGILEALAVIDESLKLCKRRGIEDSGLDNVYSQNKEYHGEFKPAMGRIDKVKNGEGGLC